MATGKYQRGLNHVNEDVSAAMLDPSTVKALQALIGMDAKDQDGRWTLKRDPRKHIANSATGIALRAYLEQEGFKPQKKFWTNHDFANGIKQVIMAVSGDPNVKNGFSPEQQQQLRETLALKGHRPDDLAAPVPPPARVDRVDLPPPGPPVAAALAALARRPALPEASVASETEEQRLARLTGAMAVRIGNGNGLTSITLNPENAQQQYADIVKRITAGDPNAKIDSRKIDPSREAISPANGMDVGPLAVFNGGAATTPPMFFVRSDLLTNPKVQEALAKRAAPAVAAPPVAAAPLPAPAQPQYVPSAKDSYASKLLPGIKLGYDNPNDRYLASFDTPAAAAAYHHQFAEIARLNGADAGKLVGRLDAGEKSFTFGGTLLDNPSIVAQLQTALSKLSAPAVVAAPAPADPAPVKLPPPAAPVTASETEEQRLARLTGALGVHIENGMTSFALKPENAQQQYADIVKRITAGDPTAKIDNRTIDLSKEPNSIADGMAVGPLAVNSKNASAAPMFTVRSDLLRKPEVLTALANKDVPAPAPDKVAPAAAAAARPNLLPTGFDKPVDPNVAQLFPGATVGFNGHDYSLTVRKGDKPGIGAAAYQGLVKGAMINAGFGGTALHNVSLVKDGPADGYQTFTMAGNTLNLDALAGHAPKKGMEGAYATTAAIQKSLQDVAPQLKTAAGPEVVPVKNVVADTTLIKDAPDAKPPIEAAPPRKLAPPSLPEGFVPAEKAVADLFPGATVGYDKKNQQYSFTVADGPTGLMTGAINYRDDVGKALEAANGQGWLKTGESWANRISQPKPGPTPGYSTFTIKDPNLLRSDDATLMATGAEIPDARSLNITEQLHKIGGKLKADAGVTLSPEEIAAQKPVPHSNDQLAAVFGNVVLKDAGSRPGLTTIQPPPNANKQAYYNAFWTAVKNAGVDPKEIMSPPDVRQRVDLGSSALKSNGQFDISSNIKPAIFDKLAAAAPDFKQIAEGGGATYKPKQQQASATP